MVYNLVDDYRRQVSQYHLDTDIDTWLEWKIELIMPAKSTPKKMTIHWERVLTSIPCTFLGMVILAVMWLVLAFEQYLEGVVGGAAPFLVAFLLGIPFCILAMTDQENWL